MDEFDSDAPTGRTGSETRRRFLVGLGVTSVVAVAGCNSNTDRSSTGTETDATTGSEPTDGETSAPSDSDGGSVQPVGLDDDALETLELAATTAETIDFTLPEES